MYGYSTALSEKNVDKNSVYCICRPFSVQIRMKDCSLHLQRILRSEKRTMFCKKKKKKLLTVIYILLHKKYRKKCYTILCIKRGEAWWDGNREGESSKGMPRWRGLNVSVWDRMAVGGGVTLG